MIVAIVLLSLFGLIFAAMAIAPTVIEEVERQPKPVAHPASPIAIAAHRSPVSTGHEPQAA